MPEHPGHDTGNSKVEIISILSHGEGEAMVHTCHRKYEWGLGSLLEISTSMMNRFHH